MDIYYFSQLWIYVINNEVWNSRPLLTNWNGYNALHQNTWICLCLHSWPLPDQTQWPQKQSVNNHFQSPYKRAADATKRHNTSLWQQGVRAVWSGCSMIRSKSQCMTHHPQQGLHHNLSQRETYIVELLVGALQRLLCFLGIWQMLYITERERERDWKHGHCALGFLT